MNAQATSAGTSMLGVYRQPAPVFTGGAGAWLWTADGARYLDFTSGIAVNAFGHADPGIAEAIRGALDTGLIHASNLFRTAPAQALADWLVAHSFADRVFFCNSGAEANEGAIKFARRWARAEHDAGKHEIVALSGAFHGRTLGALSATDRAAYREPFAPLVPGFRIVEPDALALAISRERTAAVLVEPIQAEGGVRPLPAALLRELRSRCDDAGALLVFDEVQVGLGRTGTLWAYEGAGVAPDVMTLAKPLAGGLPMGAVLLTEHVARAVQPGDHGTTFGGGPLVSAVALEVCTRIAEPGFLAAVRENGAWLGDRLAALALRHEGVRAVRGAGLIWGLELDGAAAPVVRRAFELGLLLCAAGESVVRLLPPLNVSRDELGAGIDLLEQAL